MSDISTTTEGLIIKDGKLTGYIGKSAIVIIPAGITAICESAFEDNEVIKEVILSDTVTEIRQFAFQFSSLERIALSENLRRIGDAAFIGCRSLAEIRLPEDLQEIGSCAFEECESLCEIRLPRGVKHIPSSCFLDSGLSSIDLANVESIGLGALSSCQITEIKLPETIKRINSNVFQNSKLNKICSKNENMYLEKLREQPVIWDKRLPLRYLEAIVSSNLDLVWSDDGDVHLLPFWEEA